MCMDTNKISSRIINTNFFILNTPVAFRAPNDPGHAPRYVFGRRTAQGANVGRGRLLARLADRLL